MGILSLIMLLIGACLLMLAPIIIVYAALVIALLPVVVIFAFIGGIFEVVRYTFKKKTENKRLQKQANDIVQKRWEEIIRRKK